MAIVAVVLIAAAVFVARTTEAKLIAQVDAQLPAAGLQRVPPAGPPPAQSGRQPNGGASERLSSLYLGVVRDGRLTAVFIPNLTDNPPLPVVAVDGIERRAVEGEPFTTGSTAAGVRYRARAVAGSTAGESVVVAISLQDTDRTVRQLVIVESGVTALVLALLGAVTWWVIRLGVRPIKQMSDTAAAIADGDLSRRVPDVRSPRTEAGELGHALNRMLHSIEDAFAERTESETRLRRFIADASHELRTPVATIRGYAELFRTGGLDEPAQLTDAMRRTEEEAVRMGVLVEDMLHLARLDQGRPLDRVPVDLSTVADDAALDIRAVDPDRPVTTTIDRPTIVAGDDHQLRQVVTNLVRNALVHTPPGTPIEIRVDHTGGRAVLEVSDQGPGMPADVAARAFERFYRADPSRSRHRGGSGLGLSIVEATVTALGGTVRLDSEPGRGTTVRVELPLADGA
jgi:two-component system OmpR family sensor kinase